MPRGVARGLRGCVAVSVLILTSAGLYWLAQWQFAAHLRDAATHALVLAATGETPWQWSYRADDLVAGRVFGNADADFAGDCLLVRSRGEPFEIGLRLPRAIALPDFPRLRLFAFAAGTHAQVQLIVRERLDGGAWTSTPLSLAGISTATNIDVETIEWRDPDGRVSSPPSKAAMLRLRFVLPQGTTLQFNGAEFDRPTNYRKLDLARKTAVVQPGSPAPDGTTPVYRVSDTGLSAAQISALAGPASPILELPGSGRVERQRLLLDAVQSALPAAIVVQQGSLDAAFARARAARPSVSELSAAWRWFALIVYAAALLFARLYPPRRPRVRAMLEIALVLAGPLWLIVGGHFTGEVDGKQKFLIACVAAYAISLGFPRDWNWNGSRRAWLYAAAIVVFAASIGIAAYFFFDGSMRSIGSAHVLRYFGWALIQQYLVCVVCTSRWLRVTDNTAIATYLGALGFALLHTPNASLMLATFIGGLCWCAFYLRERALLPLAVSHAASALVLIALLPPSWLYSAEVSARFFQ